MSPRASFSLLAISLAVVACKKQQSFEEPEPSWERMMDQPRFDPFEPSHFFSDGRAMRTPPKGTIAIEATLGDAALLRGAVDGRYVEQIPISLDMTILSRGRDHFEVFCGACHGVDGSGQTVVATNMELRRPPSLHEARIRALPAGRIFQVISTGYGLMPPYAAQLPVVDRWAVVAYVRALQLSRNADVAALPADVRSELEATP